MHFIQKRELLFSGTFVDKLRMFLWAVCQAVSSTDLSLLLGVILSSFTTRLLVQGALLPICWLSNSSSIFSDSISS